MAFYNLTRFPKSFMALISSRSLKYTMSNQNTVYFSTSQPIANDDTPVRFTTNKASKVTISEIVDPVRRNNYLTPWYERYVILASIAIFCIYFFILREENHIDEILKGNTKNYRSPEVELFFLKQKLQYCESKQLPAAPLKNKIKLLEEEIKKKNYFNM